MNLHEGQLKYSNRKKLSIIKVNREIALWICEMAKSWMPTTISKMMSMMIIIVLLYIYIHEMLPDCCTSSQGQEESTENRDKTNESNKSKLSKTIIFIQCIRITTNIYRTARICWTTGIISKNSLKTSKKLIYLPKLKVYIVMRVNFCKLFSINTTSCHTERVFSGILHHVQMYIKTFSSSFDRFI